jgi:hypothetical protein
MRLAAGLIATLIAVAPARARAAGCRESPPACQGAASFTPTTSAPSTPRVVRLSRETWLGATLAPPSLALAAVIAPPGKNQGPDERLFREALAHEQAGRLDEARATHFRVIQEMPGSRFVGASYAAFGDHFLAASRDDPGQLELARLCYERALAALADGSAIKDYAQLKLGHALWAAGGPGREAARQAFERVAAGGAAPLRPQARHDLALVFWATGGAALARRDLGPFAGDGGLRAMLEVLGEAYLDRGLADEAALTYDDLLRAAPEAEACRLRARATEAWRSQTPRAPADERDRVLALLAELAALAERGAPAVVRRSCGEAALELVVATLGSLHHRARVPGDPSGEAASAASELYAGAIRVFGAEDLSAYRHPRLPAAPTLASLRFGLGALQMARGEWSACGLGFRELVEGSPDAAETPEAAHLAAVCFAHHVEGSYPVMDTRSIRWARDEGPESRALSPFEGAMVQSLERARCAVGADEARRATLRAEGRIWYAAGRLDRAAGVYRELGRAERGQDAALDAVLLEVGVEGLAGGEVCAEESAGALREARARLCPGARAPARCASLDRLDVAVGEAKAALIERRAAQGGPGAQADHERAARAYHDLARRCALDPIEQRRAPLCDHPETYLRAAAESYAAARLLMKGIRVRTLLLDPRYRLDRTPEARESVLLIGRSYDALAAFDEAAPWYEKFAQDYPLSEGAGEALARAVDLRLALGQDAEAERGADLLRALRGQEALAARAQVAVSIHLARREEWPALRQRLEATIPLIDERGDSSARVLGHLLLAQARERLGVRRARGETERRQALDLASSELSVEASEALAEALLREVRPPAAGERAPVFAGPAEEAAIQRFIEGPLGAWLDRRRQQLEDDARGDVAFSGPLGATRAGVAAAARELDRWVTLEREIRSLRWAGPLAHIPLWTGKLTAMLEVPLALVGAGGDRVSRRCLRRATEARSFDGEALRCERWRVDHGRGAPALDELRPRSPSTPAAAAPGAPLPLAEGDPR